MTDQARLGMALIAVAGGIVGAGGCLGWIVNIRSGERRDTGLLFGVVLALVLGVGAWLTVVFDQWIGMPLAPSFVVAVVHRISVGLYTLGIYVLWRRCVSEWGSR